VFNGEIMTEQLKPCPFCGGEADFDHDDDDWQWIECGKCHVATMSMVSAMDDCKPILVEHWNRRASQQVPAGFAIVPLELPYEMRAVIIKFSEGVAAGQCILFADFYDELIAATPTGVKTTAP